MPWCFSWRGSGCARLKSSRSRLMISTGAWASFSPARVATPLVGHSAPRALSRLMTMLERTNLIIIDDWGPEPLTAEQRRDLLEIVDDRYDKGSLLITSQVPVAQWHDIIADPT